MLVHYQFMSLCYHPLDVTKLEAKPSHNIELIKGRKTVEVVLIMELNQKLTVKLNSHFKSMKKDTFLFKISTS